MVDLLEIMARLRDPINGCPWDKEQTFSTIAPYTIEEAYEVADAIETGDMDQLEDELGDLLFQIVFYAEMSREAGGFDFDAVARRISSKMRDRHPHVFDAVDERTSVGQTIAWKPIRRRNAKPVRPEPAGNQVQWMAWRSPCPR